MTHVPDRAHDSSRVMGSYTAPLSATSAQDKLESMFSSVGAPMVKDPFTGTVHVDLSDPDHPFWKGGPRD